MDDRLSHRGQVIIDARGTLSPERNVWIDVDARAFPAAVTADDLAPLSVGSGERSALWATPVDGLQIATRAD